MPKNKLTPWGWLRNPRKRKTMGVAIYDWQYHARKLAELWCKPEPTEKTLAIPNWPNPPVKFRPICDAHAEHRALARCCGQDLLRWLDILNAAIVEGHEPLARYAAFQAGHCEARIARHVQAYDLSHAEICRYARLGGQARDKSNLAWPSQVEAMMKNNGRSLSDVCEEIGLQSGVTGRTVRNYLKNPRRK